MLAYWSCQLTGAIDASVARLACKQIQANRSSLFVLIKKTKQKKNYNMYISQPIAMSGFNIY